MPIRVTCPSCQSSSNAPDKFAGKRVRCRKCGVSVDVPALLLHDEPEPESVLQPTPPSVDVQDSPVAGPLARAVDLWQEVATLRRQLLYTQRWGIAAGILLAILIGSETLGRMNRDNLIPEYFQASYIANKAILTHELMLYGNDGKEHAVLKCSSSGQPILTLFGTNGSQVEPGFIDKAFDVPRLSFTEPGSNERISLSSMPSGAAGLYIRDNNRGSVLVEQSMIGTGITLQGSEKLGHASIAMHGRGSPVLQFMDSDEKQIFNVPPLPSFGR